MPGELSRLQLRVRGRRLISKRYSLFCSPNSTAFSHSMLGCTFLLLIFSMMSDRPHNGVGVDQYISHNGTRMPAALRDDAMKVFIMRDGRIYFGNRRVASDDLPREIRQRLETSAQHRVFLVVDQRARFRDVSIVLDDVRCSDIRDVAFLTELQTAHR